MCVSACASLARVSIHCKIITHACVHFTKPEKKWNLELTQIIQSNWCVRQWFLFNQFFCLILFSAFFRVNVKKNSKCVSRCKSGTSIWFGHRTKTKRKEQEENMHQGSGNVCCKHHIFYHLIWSIQFTLLENEFLSSVVSMHDDRISAPYVKFIAMLVEQTVPIPSKSQAESLFV